MPKASSHTSMRINGIDVAARFGFVLSGGYPSGLGLPPIRPRLSTVPGRHGVRNHGAIYDAREIEVQGQIWADDFADAQDQLDDFKGWIALPQNLKKHLVGTRGIEGMKLELSAWRPGRYFLVTYNGTSEVSAMPGADDAWEGVEIFQFSVGFLCTPPFLIGDQVIKKITTTGFHEITGLGTAPVNPTYHILGANTSPTKIVKAKHALTCDFKSIDTSGNPNKARDVFNDVDKTLTLTPAFRYMPARLAQGIGIFGNTVGNKGDVVTFTAMVDGSAPTSAIGDRLNRNQGTLSVWLTPEWKYTTTRVRYVLADGASGELTISYNPTSDRWEASDGTNVAFKASTHAAGSRTHLVMTWDKNANSLDITIDNSAGTGSNYAASTPSATVYLGSDSSSEQQIDAVVDDAGIWDIVLSSAEISSLYNGGNGARADSVASDSLLVYLSFDGTQGTSIDVSTANQGGGSGLTLKSTTTTVTAVTVAGGGDNVFFDDDRIVLYDETGYKVEGFVKPTVSAMSVPIELTKDTGDNLTNADKVGVYANFDGTQKAQAGANTEQDVTTQDIGVGLWFKRNGDPSADEVLIDKRGDLTSNGYQIYIQSDGTLTCRADDGTNDANFSFDITAFLDNKRHHLWVFFDRSAIATSKILINGISKTIATSGTMPTLTITNSQLFTVGSLADSTLDFNGDIRDVRIQIGGTEVTAAQALYQATNPLDFTTGASAGWTADGTREYWEFTANTGTDVPGGVSFNLTLTASGQWTQLAYISKNLIGNPGMENGGIGGFIALNGNPVLIKDKLTLKKDSRSLSILVDGVISNNISGNRLKVGADENYVMRGWTNLGTGDTVGFRVEGNGGFTGFYLRDSNTGWQFRETVLKTTGTQTQLDAGMNIFDSGITGNKTAYFDAFQLLPNLVNDGGLEAWTSATDLTNWSESLTGTSTVNQETTTIHSGVNATRLDVDGSNSIVDIRQTISVTIGRWYKISIWAKVDDAASTRSFKILEDISGGGSSTIHSFELTTTYQRFSIIVKANRTDSEIVRFQRNSGTANRSIYFDDISIVHLPDLGETLNPLASGFHYLPTRDYQGVLVRSGDTLVLSSIVANKDEFGFAYRLQPQFDSAVSTTGEDKTIFMFRFDATNFYRLYYDWSAAKWKLHVEHAGSTFTVESAIQTFSEGDFIELSGRYKGDGTVAAIQVNGTVYTTTTGTAGALASNPTAFHFGYSLDGTTFSEPPNSLIDDFAIFAKAPTADELIAIWTQQTPLENLNSAMVINLAMGAGDRFTADVDTQTFSFYDASVPLETDGGTYLSDRSFPTFTAEPDNRTLLYIPNAVKEIQAVHRPAYL